MGLKFRRACASWDSQVTIRKGSLSGVAGLSGKHHPRLLQLQTGDDAGGRPQSPLRRTSRVSIGSQGDRTAGSGGCCNLRPSLSAAQGRVSAAVSGQRALWRPP